MNTKGHKFDLNDWIPFVARDPSEIEKTELTKLESESKKLYSTIQALEENMSRAATVEELTSFIAHLSAWLDSFKGFEAAAQHLQTLGLPQLYERLAAVQFDLQQRIAHAVQTHQILKRAEEKELLEAYQEMAKTSQEGIRRRGEILNKTREQISTILEDMAEKTRKVHKEMNEGFIKYLQDKCPDCEYDLRGKAVTGCPKCGRKFLPY